MQQVQKDYHQNLLQDNPKISLPEPEPEYASSKSSEEDDEEDEEDEEEDMIGNVEDMKRKFGSPQRF